MKRWAFLLAVATGSMLWGVSAGSAGEHAYVGSKNCKKCHLQQHKSWSETKMAQAFELLKPGVAAEAKQKAGFDPGKDYTRDAQCLPCHTTGYGKPGGFVDIETTPDLAGIGCEECHGPGGTYTQEGYMTLKNKEYKKADLVAVGLVDTVSAKQCLHCHDKEKNPFAPAEPFDFEKMKEKDLHQRYPLKYKH